MKIALFGGGLGNQTFQYIFSRFIEMESGEPCYLDDSAFFRDEIEHNGFELTRVFPNAKPHLLSQCFSEDVWQYMVKKGNVVQQLRDAGEDFALIAETKDYHFDGNVIPVSTNQFSPWIANAKGNIYYHGYWINRDWLKNEHEPVLRQELQFEPLRESRNKTYEEKIKKTSSIGIHIRRGDFVELGIDEHINVYRTAINVMRSKVKGAHFFVFSDDLPWCRENTEELGFHSGDVTFVEGNVGKNSYIDMQLMSYCKNMILANVSCFSYLATLLNINDSVMVYNTTTRQV